MVGENISLAGKKVFASRKSLNRRVGILFARNWELLKAFEQRQDVIKWYLRKVNQAITNEVNQRKESERRRNRRKV